MKVAAADRRKFDESRVRSGGTLFRRCNGTGLAAGRRLRSVVQSFLRSGIIPSMQRLNVGDRSLSNIFEGGGALSTTLSCVAYSH